jgi:hypothetical protein
MSDWSALHLRSYSAIPDAWFGKISLVGSLHLIRGGCAHLHFESVLRCRATGAEQLFRRSMELIFGH